METWIIITAAIGYIILLFLVAFLAERNGRLGKSWVNHPLIYALSLAVYCTAWTFYGSVGRASSSGIGFLPIYLGPLITAPVWYVILRKIIQISKIQRITSIADFISSRYGKSTFLGILVTIISVIGVIPYISIQLKAIATSYTILTDNALGQDYQTPFYFDSAWYITIALTVFAIFFGTRNLDPNERHEGLVAAVAFESIVKLLAFLTVGIFVTYGLFNGFSDLFATTGKQIEVQQIFTFEGVNLDPGQWFALILISMSAILFLPRQFHLAVVENTNPDFTRTASWLFPSYLLLINIFVIPIAIAGLFFLGNTVSDPDAYVLTVPLFFNNTSIALIAGIGGFAAATSMVVVAVIALSIMISNNLVLPILLKPRIWKTKKIHNISNQLLGIRRLSIIVVLLLAYAYFRLVTTNYALVSIGLISFAAIAQFMPATIGGIYWKRATKPGAIASLLVGFIVWAFTLPIPSLLENAQPDSSIFHQGYLGLSLLKPYALFGLEGMDQITHTTFWSLLLNTLTYITVSLNTRPSALELTQADIFIEIDKHIQSSSTPYEVFRRKAQTQDVVSLLERFLSPEKAKQLIQLFEKQNNVDLKQTTLATPELINYVETHLSGAIGAASAKVIIRSIAQEDPISLDEMFQVLEQTKEIYQYSKALESKSAELEQTTQQLRTANEQLKALDRLKADFISTITHEIRTPITSIKAFSKIILDNEKIEIEKKDQFLNIILSESDRITRLVNQVLDLRKIETKINDEDFELINLNSVLKNAYQTLVGLMDEKGIHHSLQLPEKKIYVNGVNDKLVQVIVNLISNAIKFCDSQASKIKVSLEVKNIYAVISVKDNGIGIKEEHAEIIFDKFTQISNQEFGKPTGSGLGLFITKTIIEKHKGRVFVNPQYKEGAEFIIEIPAIKEKTK